VKFYKQSPPPPQKNFLSNIEDFESWFRYKSSGVLKVLGFIYLNKIKPTRPDFFNYI